MKQQACHSTEACDMSEPRLDEIEPGIPSPMLEIAECSEEAHPTMMGRVRVRMRARDSWVLCLATVRPRIGDHLLVAQLGDGGSIVVGVVDGVRERQAPPARADHVRRIRDDERIVIESSAGEPLVEVRAEAGRTTLRVLSESTRIESAGKLELVGESVAIVATKGPILLSANEDVRVAGETIHLN